MKPDLDQVSVRRIWAYNIEPLIEDQLFGQHDAIERFRFDAILKRLGPDAGVSDEAGQPAEMYSGDEGRDVEDHDIGGRDDEVDGGASE